MKRENPFAGITLRYNIRIHNIYCRCNGGRAGGRAGGRVGSTSNFPSLEFLKCTISKLLHTHISGSAKLAVSAYCILHFGYYCALQVS